MPVQAKVERNKELILKRLKDPQKWGWGKLADHYSIHRSYVKEIFVRDLPKYASSTEIEEYEARCRELSTRK